MAEANQTSHGLPVVNFPVVAWRALFMVALYCGMALFFLRGMQRALINPVARQLESFTSGLRLGGKVETVDPAAGLPSGTGLTMPDNMLDGISAMLPAQGAVFFFAAGALLCGWAALAFLRRWMSGRPALTISPAGITSYGTGMSLRTIPWDLYDGTIILKGNYQVLSKERTWTFMRDRVNVPLFLIGESARKLDGLIHAYATAMRGLSPSHPARQAHVHQKAEPLGGIAAPLTRDPAPVAVFPPRPAPAPAPAAPAPSATPAPRSGIRFAGSRNTPVSAEPRRSPHEIRRRV